MTECECGCGEDTAGGPFRPGHDQKLRAQLESRVGGIFQMRSLVEAMENFRSRKSTPESFAATVREIFESFEH